MLEGNVRDELQRLRDEQQRIRDEQQKVRDETQRDGDGKKEGENKPGDLSRQEDPKNKDETRKEEDKKKKGIRPLTILLILIVAGALAVGGFFLWGYWQSYESTDDAQVDGHIDSVSSRITGTVTNVYVQDNQAVNAGQVLVDLDPKDYEVARLQAEAALAQSQAQVTAQSPNVPIINTTNATTASTSASDVASALAGIASAEANYATALANVRHAQATHANDVAEVARFKALVDKDEVSREQYDAKVTAAQSSQASVEANQAAASASLKAIDQAKAQAAQARAREEQALQNAPRNIAIQRATIEGRRADVIRNKAQVDQALLNLQYTKIKSPASGVVGKKSVEAGTRVSPGQELLAIVPLDDIWITANFKETQLRQMRPNQRVTIKVDAYNRKYEGYIESIAAATGAKYSLLPPENATGNYVKVVQRIPVRIRLKEGENSDHRLRPGMSVEPKVWLQ
ncbi:MAG: HlyD family efflux transporter periplasmic adaptor subunit [Acidobacteriota bacterium]|nr:HlyD family efflux transporter periplasmic adaptor subunit [Acidobacteriota bacterium]